MKKKNALHRIMDTFATVAKDPFAIGSDLTHGLILATCAQSAVTGVLGAISKSVTRVDLSPLIHTLWVTTAATGSASLVAFTNDFMDAHLERVSNEVDEELFDEFVSVANEIVDEMAAIKNTLQEIDDDGQISVVPDAETT